jgi:hypothetical protein
MMRVFGDKAAVIGRFGTGFTSQVLCACFGSVKIDFQQRSPYSLKCSYSLFSQLRESGGSGNV